ncbi:MAG: FAD-dependent oxidoreductase [Planctomycetes bacterium]|nr:FAD-dependent oxidoreductase [Planctomycetota bacterium]MCB9916959.1 FAD-dependent oxidoreductase [Planctomycetota bacterium]
MNGRPFRARYGTSVAAAMLESGFTSFRTSRRGEPRTPFCGMGTCFECRVTIDGVPYRRTCQVAVREGMRIETESTPSVERHTPLEASHEHLRADVVVVGSGPAGIAAATLAAESGCDVVLVDDNGESGGQIWRARSASTRRNHEPAAKRRWVERCKRAGVRVLTQTTIFDAASANRLIAETAKGTLELSTDRLVLATGATEFVVPVPGWTLPRVTSVGGLQALLESGLDLEGKRVLLAGSGPLLLAVAKSVIDAGALVRVEEEAPSRRLVRLAQSLLRHPRKLAQAVRLTAKTRRFTKHGRRLVEIRAGEDARGMERIASFVDAAGVRHDHRADWVAIGHGLVPRTRLAHLLGIRTSRDAAGNSTIDIDESGRTSNPACFAAGECTGIGGVDVALAEGAVAGLAAAGRLLDAARMATRVRKERGFARSLERVFAVSPSRVLELDPRAIVCRCEDVERREIDAYGSMRDCKLKSRCGMGPCQGRVCGPIVARLIGNLEDRVRPPLFPVRLDHLLRAGCSYDSPDELPRRDAGDHDSVHE